MATYYQKRFENLAGVVPVELYSQALHIFKSEKVIVRWFYRQNPALDDTPYECCRQGKTEQVSRVMGQLEKMASSRK